MTRLRHTIGHTAVYMLGIVANRGLASLFLLPFLSRVLDPVDFARWDLCTTTIILMSPIFEMGITDSLMRFYHYHVHDLEARKKAIGTGLSLVFLTSALSAISILLLETPLATAIFGSESYVDLIRIMIVSTVSMTVSNQMLVLLRAQEKSIRVAILGFIRAGSGILLTLVLVKYAGMGLKGALWGEVGGILIMSIAGMGSFLPWCTLKLNRSHIKPILAYSLPLLPSIIIGSITPLADRYYIKAWMGMENLAVYSLGFKVALIIMLITRAFRSAWSPTAFRMANEPDGGAASFATLSRYFIFAMMLAGMGMTVCAPELVTIFGGNAIYTPAKYIVPWIVFGYIIHALSLYAGTPIAISNKTTYLLLISSVVCITKFGLIYLLIPRFGIIGAAASTLLAFSVEFIISFAIAQRLYPIPYKAGRMLAFIFLTATAAITVISLYDYNPVLTLPARLVVVALYLIISIKMRVLSIDELFHGAGAMYAQAARIPLLKRFIINK